MHESPTTSEVSSPDKILFAAELLGSIIQCLFTATYKSGCWFQCEIALIGVVHRDVSTPSRLTSSIMTAGRPICSSK